jgi:ribosomal protein S18
MITNSFASVPVKEETRKKYCRFRKNGIRYIDYKDPDFLLKLVNEQGKLLPRRQIPAQGGSGRQKGPSFGLDALRGRRPALRFSYCSTRP